LPCVGEPAGLIQAGVWAHTVYPYSIFERVDWRMTA
jgi:hypothetical protein